MSLYDVQKLLFHVNNDAAVRQRFATEHDALLAEYALTDEERRTLG
jgi:hypothetical protein